MFNANDDQVANSADVISPELQDRLAITNDAVHDTLLAAIQAMTLAQEKSSRSNDAIIVMMGALNKNIETLIEQTKQTNDLIKNEGRLNRFQSALHHCHVGAFDYWEGGAGKQGRKVHSSELLVQRILTSFFNGKAHAMRSSCHTGSHNSKGLALEAGRKDFRKKLVDQIEALIGQKAQILDKGDGILHIMCLPS